jgi:superfamily II DNA/RNA helicase
MQRHVHGDAAAGAAEAVGAVGGAFAPPRAAEGPAGAGGGDDACAHESKHDHAGKAAGAAAAAGLGASSRAAAWGEGTTGGAAAAVAVAAGVAAGPAGVAKAAGGRSGGVSLASATAAVELTAPAPAAAAAEKAGSDSGGGGGGGGRMPADMTVTGGEGGAAAAAVTAVATFDAMGLPTALLRGVYGYGFEEPSPIQSVAIPRMMAGGDLIAQAQSGTGKTGAFAVGLLARVDPAQPHVQAVVLSPTRELAEQTHGVVTALARHMGVRVHLSMGGTSLAAERAAAAGGAQVVVASPGRLLDMVLERRVLSLRHLRVLVLDEADRMLEAGFRDDVTALLEGGGVPDDVDLALFSATLPADALDLAERIMRRPVRILLKEDRLTLEGIRQYHVPVGSDADKVDVLLDLYATVSVSKAILFVNSRRQATALAERLQAADFSVAVLHAEVPSSERREVMARFRTGGARVLVTTDLSARGIDVQQVSLVVNFSLPPDRETYIHRIGRTGRYARKGAALTFLLPGEAWALRDLETTYRTSIPELPADVGRALAVA